MKSFIVSLFIEAFNFVLNTNVSLPVPPYRISLPNPPFSVSFPAPPFNTLFPVLPLITLLRVLPVPFIAAVPVNVRFSTFAPNVYVIDEFTKSVRCDDNCVTTYFTLST